jgi:hypothetical protein
VSPSGRNYDHGAFLTPGFRLFLFFLSILFLVKKRGKGRKNGKKKRKGETYLDLYI